MTDPFWTQTHNWTLMTADAVSGTFAVGTTGSDPALNPASYYGVFSVAQTATAVSLVWTPFKPFKVWQNMKFRSNAGNAAIAGSGANPSGDGISNLVKYALGLDPAVASVVGTPVTTLVSNHLQMEFKRNSSATDIIIQVKASSDLFNCTTITTLPAGASAWTMQGAAVTDTGSQVTVVDDTATAPGTARFLRLQVTQP